MASEGQGRASQAPALTSLPRVEDLPGSADGFEREKVSEAFEAFRRHTTQLQDAPTASAAQIRRTEEEVGQLLSAVGLVDEAIERVAQTIVSSAEATTEASRGTPSPATPPKLREQEPAEEAAAPERESESPPLSPPDSFGPSPPGPQGTGSKSEDESAS